MEETERRVNRSCECTEKVMEKKGREGADKGNEPPLLSSPLQVNTTHNADRIESA